MRVPLCIRCLVELLVCTTVAYPQDFKIAPTTLLHEGSNFADVSIASDSSAGFLVTWRNTYDIVSERHRQNYACRFSKTGEMLDSAAILLGADPMGVSAYPYYCPNAVFARGNWIVVTNQGGLFEWVGAQRLTPSGVLLDRLPVNICNSIGYGTLYYPVIATNGREILCVAGIAGGGLYGSIVDANLDTLVGRFLIFQQNLQGSHPKIVVNGNDFFITFVNYDWINNQNVGNIKLMRVSARGEVLSIQTVNASPWNKRVYLGVPTITVVNDTTYITFYQSTSMYGRRYLSDGQAVDSTPVRIATSPDFEPVLNKIFYSTGIGLVHHLADVVWANGSFHLVWPIPANNGMSMWSFRQDLSAIGQAATVNAECQIAVETPIPEQSFSLRRASSIGDNILTAWIDEREGDSTTVYGHFFSVRSTTAVEGEQSASRIPAFFALHQNYPNPSNPSTTIKFELPKTSHVNLTVYDILGREVSVLVNDRRNAGVHEVRFDASGLSTGVYLYRLQAGNFVHTRKLLRLR